MQIYSAEMSLALLVLIPGAATMKKDELSVEAERCLSKFMGKEMVGGSMDNAIVLDEFRVKKDDGLPSDYVIVKIRKIWDRPAREIR